MQLYQLCNLTCSSFHGRGVSPQTMLGLGRAAMPPLGVGRGHALPTVLAGRVESVSPASEQQAAQHTQTSPTGRDILKMYSVNKQCKR